MAPAVADLLTPPQIMNEVMEPTIITPADQASRSRKYVIVHLNLFSDFDWDRFGCELFRKNGFEIVPIELLIGYDGEEDSLASGNFRSIPQANRITSREGLWDILKNLSNDDLIVSTIPFGPQMHWVYHDYARLGLNYATLNITAAEDHRLVWWRTAETPRELLEIKFIDYVSLARRFIPHLLKITNPKLGYWKAKAPTWWFRAGTAHSPLGNYFPKQGRAKLVKINSWNYEIAQREAAKTEELFPGQHEGKYIVYLDQMITGHPDSNIAHNRGLNFRGGPSEEVFLPTLRKFFEMLERQTSYKVIVAGSPKSNYEAENNPYGRRIIHGETPNLIRHCAFALATTTSAVTFAVIYRKPVMIFTTDEVERQFYFRGSAMRLAGALGQKRINIDRIADDQPVDLPRINENSYARYMSRYVKEPDSSDLPIWEVMFETMTGGKPITAGNPRPKDE